MLAVLILATAALSAWCAPALAQEPEVDALAAGLSGDVFVAPPTDSLQAEDGSLSPGFAQTSEFLIGHVAVGIVLPESDGELDASTEDWTETERDLVRQQVMAAVAWWAAREPRAHLNFTFDDGTLDPTPTNYEPINHSQAEQGLWITSVMNSKGYAFSGSYFDQVRQYNNALRQAHGADWAFTIFVVDSSNDVDGRFSGGSNSLFAYAYLNGPFAVMTYDNASYGIAHMDAVLAHEMGHLFGAWDQYSAAAIPCTAAGGYLGVESQNSQYGACLSNVPSIMRGGVVPFSIGAIDPYARGQVGWLDSDGDDVLDPIDTPTSLTPGAASQSAQAGETFSYAGEINQTAFTSPNRVETVINRFLQVEYRVNRETWRPTGAEDGAFDSLVEAFSLITQPLDGEDASVEIRAVDRFGNVLLQEAVLGLPEAENQRLFIPLVVVAR